jgi:hypothetical protein
MDENQIEIVKIVNQYYLGYRLRKAGKNAGYFKINFDGYGLSSVILITIICREICYDEGNDDSEIIILLLIPFYNLSPVR